MIAENWKKKDGGMEDWYDLDTSANRTSKVWRVHLDFSNFEATAKLDSVSVRHDSTLHLLPALQNRFPYTPKLWFKSNNTLAIETIAIPLWIFGKMRLWRIRKKEITTYTFDRFSTIEKAVLIQETA